MVSFRDALNSVANKSGAPVRPTPLVEAAPTPAATPVVESGRLFGGPSPAQLQDSMGAGGDAHVLTNHHTEVNKRLRALQDHIAATHTYLKSIGSPSVEHQDHLADVSHSLELSNLHLSGAVKSLGRANKCV